MKQSDTIYLRLFEPEDFEKTYKWRNDFNSLLMTCGPLRFVSKEIEKKWAYSKATNNSNEIYLAACLKENDEMIGYCSILNIDWMNRKCTFGGLVIGDKQQKDGDAFMDIGTIIIDYIFNELNMNRTSTRALKEHSIVRASLEAAGWVLEGIERESIFKNGQYHDACNYSMLKSEFLSRPDMTKAEKIKKMVQIAKRIKSEIK